MVSAVSYSNDTIADYLLKQTLQGPSAKGQLPSLKLPAPSAARAKSQTETNPQTEPQGVYQPGKTTVQQISPLNETSVSSESVSAEIDFSVSVSISSPDISSYVQTRPGFSNSGLINSVTSIPAPPSTTPADVRQSLDQKYAQFANSGSPLDSTSQTDRNSLFGDLSFWQLADIATNKDGLFTDQEQHLAQQQQQYIGSTYVALQRDSSVSISASVSEQISISATQSTSVSRYA
jgi:hypothetical protein